MVHQQKSKRHLLNRKNNVKQGPDEFIIAYNKMNKDIKINSIDTRRVVFISILGLYQSWQSCPPYTLYSAIFMLPLKRDWIYNPDKYNQEIQSSIVSKLSTFHSDIDSLRLFTELIKWKDSQKLVFWMLDDYESSAKNKDPLIDPFWYVLNETITNLYDPITRKNYSPLHLNCDYWTDNKHFISKYTVKTSTVLSELYFKTMKFKVIKEILYQSNPSLRVIISYGENEPVQFSSLALLDDNNTENKQIKRLFDDELSDESSDEPSDESTTNNTNNDWWISELYDPYDI